MPILILIFIIPTNNSLITKKLNTEIIPKRTQMKITYLNQPSYQALSTLQQL